ncbi:contractile injection system tape measure protein [Niastella populi]|uniref:Uncharacterized protein n=1 Tax=Niastella populi TaxID=550983 RepID=A0A1V9GCN9_9BACT|nr:contractile injection system tape measure protein [Niastella populi]OQP68334.1 hypothetical protein A4R26_00560 [Niastella populi]
MQHLIKKQIIELTIDKRLDAFDIQQQVSDWYWHHFLSLLEIELNKLSAPGTVQYIDRLEIDLGAIDVQQLQKTQLHKIAIPAITNKLQEHIDVHHTTTGKRAGPQHAFTQWLHYMQKGYLPWNVLRISEDWLHKVLEELAVNHHSVTMLREEIRNNKTVAIRIAQQHTAAWLTQLITVFTASDQNRLPGAIAEAEQFFNSLQKAGAAQLAVPNRKECWQQIITLAAATGTTLTTTQLATTIIQENLTIEHLPALEKIMPQTAGYTQLQPALAAVQHQLQREAGARQREAGDTAISRDKKNIADNGEQPAADSKRRWLKEEDGMFVQHAGLVLVHPFLRSLFSLCGLLGGKHFSNAASRQKAIYLLHYIATGATTAEEHELVIPKILCGYAIEEPVNTDIILTINELQEADDLLRAAISQWNILKNTSPDGLRQGFLQRNGKLYTKNEQLYIAVEKNAIDVLLDHLPWNLSLIRLPWWGEIIRVEWR